MYLVNRRLICEDFVCTNWKCQLDDIWILDIYNMQRNMTYTKHLLNLTIVKYATHPNMYLKVLLFIETSHLG